MPRVYKVSQLKPEVAAEKNFKVYQDQPDYIRGKLKVNLSELNPKARNRVIARRVGAIAAAGALVFAANPNGFALFGVPSQPVSQAEMIRDGERQAMQLFSKENTAQKFATQYASSPVQGVYAQEHAGGRGVIGYISTIPGTTSRLLYGQDCLTGSAYDTTPSTIRGRAANGDISAVASLQVEGDGMVVVHPAGSNADALRFTQTQSSGELLPDQATQRTLEAYGCYTGGLAMSFLPDGNAYEAIQVAGPAN